MNPQTFFAPAKLNLFLHVTGRRPDGYHTIESAFQLLDFGDRISISTRADGVIERGNDVVGVAPEADLAVRAARLLQQSAQVRLGADIVVDKRIPMGGGMGGGSSDAATVLLALNRLWGVEFSRRQLMELGLALGADVPFFLYGRNAFARGVGEQLAPLPLPPLWYVVLTPQMQVPTAAIFAAEELTRNAKSVKIADFAADARFFVPSPAFRNDLQPVAVAKYAQIGEALAALRAACVTAAAVAAAAPVIDARMTGSGACVFAGFGQESVARAVLTACPAALDGRVVCGLRQHPLYGWAGKAR